MKVAYLSDDFVGSRKLPSRRELISAEKKQDALKRVRPVKDRKISRYSVFLKSTLLLLQVLVVIVVPVSGVLSSPLSSLAPAESYESMLEKVENSVLDSSTRLGSVSSADSRYKVRAGANNLCVPSGSANGASQVNKNFVLQWPMLEGTYDRTSPFGYRNDPATGRGVLHSGVDMAGPVGTPIMAIADGRVVTVDVYGGAGRVILRHKVNGVEVDSWYLHMYSNGIYVKEGQSVKRGDIIAGVGSSGYSTGPHLHFEVHPDGGDAVDPERWLKENRAVLIPKNC